MTNLIRATGLVALSVVCFAQVHEDSDWPEARAEWFYNRRSSPSGRIPLGARVKAFAEIERIDRAARAARTFPASRVGTQALSSPDSAVWTLIGPSPADTSTKRPIAGRIAAIAIDPRDNNTIYLGTASGGVWKTLDGGTTWKPLTDNQPSLATGSIALDPKNPDVIYVGTGEENFSHDNYYGAGILKSTNAGSTWTNIQGPFLHGYIGSIAVSPSNSQVVLCTSGTYTSSSTSQNGVWRSADGGATWNRVLTGIGTALVFDPINTNIVYAAVGDVRGSSANGVYRSTDGGQTWSVIRGSGANAFPTANVGRIVLALAPTTPTTLYAAVHNRVTSELLDIYKSTDSGGIWNPTNAPNICPGDGNGGQCNYDIAIAVHPKNANVVFAAGDYNIARTLDGGANWSPLHAQGIWFTGPNGVSLHVDEHVLTFTNDGAKLFVGNDGGIYSTTDITVSQTSQINWTDLNATLSITQFYPGFAIHPSNINRALGGTQDNLSQLYTGTPSWQSVACGDGGYAAFDNSSPNIAFVACTSRNLPVLHRSTDSGSTFHTSSYGVDLADWPRADFIPPMVLDPSNPQNVYFGTYRLWRSQDSGGKFLPISGDLTQIGGGSVTAIAVAPSDSKTIYVGVSNPYPHQPSISASPKIKVTNNALDSTPSWSDRSSSLPSRVLTQIVVDFADPATAYAAFSGFSGDFDNKGHVFKTTDAGADWTDISGNLPNLPVNNLVLDPDLPNTLYVATDLGVMVSQDGGATWSSLGMGLPKVVVHSLVLHRPTRTLRAATYGRSVWDIAVPLTSRSLQPSITALNPSTANVGGAGFTLQVTGANLVSGTVLRWNGSVRSTTIVNNGQLTAAISASDIAHVGRVAIDVLNPSGGAGISNAMSFVIGPAPVSTSEAFVSAAFPTGGDSLAPNSIGSLYGANLAGSIIFADQTPPLPLILGEASLSILGTSLPLFYVSPGQINFQLPSFPNLTVPARYTLVIQQGTLSTSVPITITPFAPGIFTTNSRGSGQAAALIAGTAFVAAPVGAFPGSRPVRRGEYVSLFCTGLGHVTNTPSLGSVSPSDPLSETTTTPQVSVGGVNARVTFSGLAPGYVGLYQVNVQIPNNAPLGNVVSVGLSIGGVIANTVSIAVQ
jgi:uncharacterized protein (TIGR03437 family)